MNIYGIGTDIVECVRIKQMIDRHGELFLRRVFTEREITYCQSRKRATEHFAGRWAAKEAVFKSLGSGWRKGMCWTEIEIRHDDAGKPTVFVSGTVREHIQAVRVADVHISISHCHSHAMACAIALRADAEQG